MKTIETIILHGNAAVYSEPFSEIEGAIKASKIIIPPIVKGNGVKPIKIETTRFLEKKGWDLEHRMNLEGMRSKPLDAFKDFGNFNVGLEWETGNISSSFRALMKLYKAVLEQKIHLGVHVLPSRDFYKYLTDRVGNISEMIPYLDVYKRIKLPNKTCMAIIVVEHDKIDSKASPIPKGLDGMSLSRRSR